MDKFKDGSEKMLRGIQHAREGFTKADDGYIEVLEGLHDMYEGHERRMAELQETIHRLETLLLDRR